MTKKLCLLMACILPVLPTSDAVLLHTLCMLARCGQRMPITRSFTRTRGAAGAAGGSHGKVRQRGRKPGADDHPAVARPGPSLEPAHHRQRPPRPPPLAQFFPPPSRTPPPTGQLLPQCSECKVFFPSSFLNFENVVKHLGSCFRGALP